MIIRFENHIFYQYWGKAHADQYAQHFRYNQVQPWTGHQWRLSNNQSWMDCHASLASEWDVFNFACTLDQTAARMSISMGAPQIMGFNYSTIGYSTVNDMYAAFTGSERDQVIGFFDFVQGVLPESGAVKALQALDYKAFATSYNGSGQADYYANLMKTANDAFTALQPVSIPPVVVPAPPQIPSTPPTPPVTSGTTDDQGRISVIVNTNVVKPGLNLRKLPSFSAEILGVEPIGSKLLVLDDANQALPRIGKGGEWLLVKDDKGRRGYVAAVYVKQA